MTIPFVHFSFSFLAISLLISIKVIFYIFFMEVSKSIIWDVLFKSGSVVSFLTLTFSQPEVIDE